MCQRIALYYKEYYRDQPFGTVQGKREGLTVDIHSSISL
jgi:hypothetical protein